MKKHIAFLLLLFPALLLQAQPYLVKQLGIEQGLSNNYVVSIAQDKQGFLWFATEEGLNKFDGTRFVSYYKNGHNSITGNELNDIYADPTRPILWIATQRAGLNAYDYSTNTFSAYQNNPQDPHSLITNDVTNISPAARPTEGLWLSTYHRGVDYFDFHTRKFTHYNKKTVPQLTNEQAWTVIDDNDGHLYIGHVSNGMSILSLKDKTVRHFAHDPDNPHSLPGNEVRCILKDSIGNIWVGTNHGLALFDATTGHFINFRNNQSDERGVLNSYIFSIHLFRDNKLWISTEFNGIATLDLKQSLFLPPQQLRFEYIREGDDERSLPNASIRYIFEDSYDNIWIGTWGGGINFIGSEPPLFSTRTYSPLPASENSLNNKVVSSICTDSQDRLWMGTDGGGINVFDQGKSVAFYKKETGHLGDNSVLSAFRDSENNLWFGTFQGSISCYNDRLKRFLPIHPGGNDHLDIRAFCEDHQRNIWIGSSEGVFVYSLAEGEITHHYTTQNSKLPTNLIRSIAQDANGRLWIGTFGNGMGVYTPDLAEVKHFSQHEGFSSNTINHIFRDSRKRMWVATGEGLVCFSQPHTFEHNIYQRKEGLINTHIRAITEDKRGNIWASTNAGISCYVAAKDSFYHYAHTDGVPAGSFMSGSVAKDRNERIYFGSNNGICSFNPEMTIANRLVPPATISEMKIFGRLMNQANNETVIPLYNSRQVELTHDQNSFSIAFNVQDYSLINQVEYAYMLRGLENSWYTVNEPNSVTFRNIPPGYYEFQVKTRIHNQEWTDTVTRLAIRIHPPLWLTWWAKLLYILLGMGTLYLILCTYKKQIDIQILYQLEKKDHEQEQELNNERLRFYTNITHELRTPLTLIIGPLEDMQRDPALPARQAQKVSVIHQSAIRLLNLINQILEFRKTETQNKKLCVSKANLVPLIYEIGFKYKELNRNPHIAFEIEIETETMPLYFDKEIVTIILDNLISNAIKYTAKGKITLSLGRTLRNEVACTEIRVSDTGYGISAEALPRIFDRYYQESSQHQASGTGIGLALVKNLVQLHGGEIGVESTVETGSCFCVSLLTDHTYPDALHAEPAPTEDQPTPPEEHVALREHSGSSKPLLLVVEDNEDIRDYITEAFAADFEVMAATNGEQGLQIALSHVPDIIVSDIMMPVMDGIALCRQLKEDVRTSHIPIILLTAKDSLQDKEQGYQIGADSYLTKPFSATLLHSRINNLLESRRKLISQFSSSRALTDKRATIMESLSKLDHEFIEKVTQLIEENLSSEKIDITYLSDKMCMSGSTLYRKMKALTGLSTNEFIRKTKMQNAEKLLLSGKYTISEIAFKVGINSNVYFRQCFKDEFGSSPSDYLKKLTAGG